MSFIFITYLCNRKTKIKIDRTPAWGRTGRQMFVHGIN